MIEVDHKHDGSSYKDWVEPIQFGVVLKEILNSYRLNGEPNGINHDQNISGFCSRVHPRVVNSATIRRSIYL